MKYRIEKMKMNESNVAQFIYDLRVNVLKITIVELVDMMGWANEKYYCKIVNGVYNKETKKTIYSQPTIKYLFEGLEYGFKTYGLFIQKKQEILNLLLIYFLPSLNKEIKEIIW